MFCTADTSLLSVGVSLSDATRRGILPDNDEVDVLKEFDALPHKGDNPGAWTCVAREDVRAGTRSVA